jgi:hypothetical protein
MPNKIKDVTVYLEEFLTRDNLSVCSSALIQNYIVEEQNLIRIFYSFIVEPFNYEMSPMLMKYYLQNPLSTAAVYVNVPIPQV